MEASRNSLPFPQQVKDKIRAIRTNDNVQRALEFSAKHLSTFARACICVYFFNFAIQEFVFYAGYGVPGFPIFALPVHIFGSYLVFVSFKEVIVLVWMQLAKWIIQGHPVYLNELMVKKFSILGCIILLVINDPYFKKTTASSKKAFVGLITSPKVSRKISVALLVARLLISTLFLYVGYKEITTQFALSSGVRHHGHVHKRPEGDGHDSFFPKISQFALAIPFIVGYKTRHVALMLAASLLLEAFIFWPFWQTPAAGLPWWYSLHARDHFCVNVGVAGGLLFLQKMGAGRYTVDELLKKKE